MVRPGAPVRNDPRTHLVHFQLPIVVQQRGHHGGPDVVGRVETEVTVVRPVGVHPRVVHEQQHATGCDGGEQRALGRRVWGAQQGRVLRRDQVEGRRRERRLHQSGVHPCNGDPGIPSVPGRPLQRHPRNLERGHLPAVPGEPDGVRTLPATDVEHSPRREAGHLDHQCAVGLAAPQLLPVQVAVIPFRLHRRISDVLVGGGEGVGVGRSCCVVCGHGPNLAHRVASTQLLLPIQHSGPALASSRVQVLLARRSADPGTAGE